MTDGTREVLTWETFGQASRDLAQAVVDDGYRPMLPPVPQTVDLAAKRSSSSMTSRTPAAPCRSSATSAPSTSPRRAARYIYEKDRSAIQCDYVWKRTNEWIDFPWSSKPPVS